MGSYDVIVYGLVGFSILRLHVMFMGYNFYVSTYMNFSYVQPKKNIFASGLILC